MEKKGQLSLYIIIAIVIVAVSIILMMVSSRQDKGDVEAEITKIKRYINDCVKKSSEIMLQIGRTSGYYRPPTLSTEEGIAYYFYEGENLVPSIHIIESEIAEGFKEKLEKCINNFSQFKKSTLQINATKPTVTAVVTTNNIYVDVTFSVLVVGKRTSFLNYSNEQIIGVRLGKIYRLASDIVDMQLKEGTYLTDFFAIKDNLNVTYKIENNIIVFEIKDFESKINNEAYSFLFAGKLS